MEAITITQITPPELALLIENSIRKFLPVQSTLSPKQEVLIDLKEAADFIKLSVSSMYRLCSEKKIPNLKRGGKILFSKDELLAWAKEGRRKTIMEIAQNAEEHLGALGQKKMLTSKSKNKL